MLDSYKVVDGDKQSLTPREIDCLRLLIGGKSAKEIALSLDISFRTVEEYLAQVRVKLDCQKRSDLFRVAYQLGFKPMF